MTDWGRTLDEIFDGLTMPQFRLMTRMRQRRIVEERRWDLQMAAFSIQSKEQSEAWGELMESLSDLGEGEEAQSDGGGFSSPSKRYPLLHELSPAQVALDPKLRKIVRFRAVKDTSA